MKIVKVKGIGVQVNGVSYFKDDIFKVNDEEYETIKDFVQVIKADEESAGIINERVVIIKVEDETVELKEVEEYLYSCLEKFGINEVVEDKNAEGNGSDNSVGTNESEDEELEALKDRAKELGIRNTHNMKKETLIDKIQELEEANAGENQNPEGE